MSWAFDMLADADIALAAQNGRRSEPHADLAKANLASAFAVIAEARAHWWASEDVPRFGETPAQASEAYEVLGNVMVPARLLDPGLMALLSMFSPPAVCSRVFGSLSARLRVAGSR